MCFQDNRGFNLRKMFLKEKKIIDNEERYSFNKKKMFLIWIVMWECTLCWSMCKNSVPIKMLVSVSLEKLAVSVFSQSVSRCKYRVSENVKYVKVIKIRQSNPISRFLHLRCNFPTWNTMRSRVIDNICSMVECLRYPNEVV